MLLALLALPIFAMNTVDFHGRYTGRLWRLLGSLSMLVLASMGTSLLQRLVGPLDLEWSDGRGRTNLVAIGVADIEQRCAALTTWEQSYKRSVRKWLLRRRAQSASARKRPRARPPRRPLKPRTRGSPETLIAELKESEKLVFVTRAYTRACTRVYGLESGAPG